MPAERSKIKEDVEVHGLALVVVGDWYSADHAKSLVFYDDNTRSWWTPVTGGANLPAINELLEVSGPAGPL